MPEFAVLLEGYRRFRENAYPAQKERYDRLAKEGQKPKLMVIACSDSRVDPAQIFDVDPGEIFVVRNVAALVPPFETTPGLHGVSAALEFAVQVLEVKQIIVMGHGMCGGCTAALSQEMRGSEPGEGGFIASWIGLLDEAREPVVRAQGNHGVEAQRAMELAAVKVSLANLRTFPAISRKEQAGQIKLRGAWFTIAGGMLHVLDEANEHFLPVA